MQMPIVVTQGKDRYLVPAGALKFWDCGDGWMMSACSQDADSSFVADGRLNKVRVKVKKFDEPNERCCGNCGHAVYAMAGAWTCPHHKGMLITDGFVAAKECTSYAEEVLERKAE